MEFTVCDTDLLYDATVGEVVIESKYAWDDCLTMSDEYETGEDNLMPSPNSSKSCEQNSADVMKMTGFHSNQQDIKFSQVNGHTDTSLHGCVSIDDESTAQNQNVTDTTGIEQRIIVIQPGNDPEKEASLVISQIADELNQKAAAAISAGIIPDVETVIEITTVMKSSDHESVTSAQQDDNGHISISGRENIPPYSVPSNQEHSAFTLRKREYQTPSPLVSAVDRRPVSVLEVLSPEQNCEDFYFRPMLSECDSGLLTIPVCLKTTADTDSNHVKSANYNRMLQSLARSSRLSISNGVVTQYTHQEKVLLPSAHSDGEKTVEPLLACTDEEDKKTSKDGYSIGICSSTRSANRDQMAVQLIKSGFVQGVIHSKQADVSRKRPPYSYLQLIQMAISSSSQKRMTLREIYQWIEHSFPYYKHLPNQGWKNSIRHNLSLYDIFIRKKASTGKACVSYWMMKQIDDDSSDSSSKSYSEDVEQIDYMSQVSHRSTNRAHTNVDLVKSLRSSAAEYKPREIVSQKSQRKGLIPLLPKPAPSVQTITLVHMPNTSSSNTSIRLVAATDPSDSISSSAGSINCSTSIQSSMLNRPSLSKRSSGTSVSDLGASYPYKVKLLCRSVSESPNDASAYFESSKSLTDDSHLLADNTGSLLGTSLDTSSLRQQFSDLQFETIQAESQKTASKVKSASDIVLSKGTNLSDSRIIESKCDMVSHSKSEPNRQNRRKQQFNQLLRTPPDKMVNKRAATRVFTTIDNLTKHAESDSQCGSLGESGYATMHDTSFALCSDLSTRPVTPPNQVWCRSPLHEMANEDDDVAQMLFTPFKADFSGIALTDLSPVLDLSTSADRDMWVKFTPTSSEKVVTRTSTPRRPLNSTPKSWSWGASAMWDKSRKSDLSPGFFRLISEFDDEELSACCKSNGIILTDHHNSLLDSGVRIDDSEFDYPLL